MAIRISGMNSGLDTESIVSALVSGYQTKVDKYKKAQTKLSWKQDAWKSVNAKVYSLYSSIDKLRYSSAYATKKTTVSDATKARVTASGSSVNGTQTLSINKLATAGYLTGGTLSSKSGEALTSNTKLSDLTSKNTDGTTNQFTTGGTINVNVGGKETAIQLSADMTVNQLATKLKDAGVNANFDEKNGRFFISSADSGKSNEFSISASDAAGMASLKSLGIYTADDSAKAVYKEWADYADLAENDPKRVDLVQNAYAKKAVDLEARANSYVTAYNNAKSVIDGLNDTYVSHDELKNSLASKKADFATDYDKYKVALHENPDDPDEITGYSDTEYDVDKLKEDGVFDDFMKANTEIKNMEAADKNYTTQETTQRDVSSKVIIGADGTAESALTDESSGAYAVVRGEVDAENATIYNDTKTAIDTRIAQSKAIYDSFGSGVAIAGAVRVDGSDAEITLNGATFTSSSNSFTVNGLTIEATGTTKDPITITTANDTQGVYDTIKDFISQYNSIINEITSLYNAENAKGYEPLTDDEKDAMSDTQVEKWEKKIKDSLLRRDTTLNSLMQVMTSSMSSVYEVNGKKYSLSTFGIGTLGLLGAEKNKQYAYHIDGDADDTSTAAKKDKLMAAIASDPDDVADFFKQLTDGLYKNIDKKMKSTTMSSAYTLYNDKEMASEYSDYTKTISKWEKRVSDMESAYFKKFTAMEKALATLNSSTTALTGMMG